MIRLAAKLAKSDFAAVASLKGHTNADLMTIADVGTWEPGELVFLGFREGVANHAEHLFYGVMCFETATAEHEHAPRAALDWLSQYLISPELGATTAHAAHTTNEFNQAIPGNDTDGELTDDDTQTFETETHDGES